jgi:dephospho-CoA kinase
MKVIGLTGSIGMGKSTTADLFRRRGIAVYDADQAVHRLSGPKGRAVAAIAAAFPDAVGAAGIDRARLGARVFADPAALRRLEAILHPLVKDERRRFIAQARAARRQLVVLDVPLLLETGGERDIDYLVVVSCPAFLQAARALARPGMTPARLAAVRARQMPDWQKRKQADRVIATGAGRRPVLRQIELIRRQLLKKGQA